MPDFSSRRADPAAYLPPTPEHPAPPAGVHSFLDISTGQIGEADRAALAENFAGCDYFTPRVITHEYGWWLNVRALDDDETREEEAMLHNDHPKLGAVLDYARAHGCWWINFDADAEWVTLP